MTQPSTAPAPLLTRDGTLRAVVSQLATAACGALLMAFAARVQVPLFPVPVTLQSCAALFIGLTAAPRTAAASMFLYVLLGIGGLPVFALGPASLGGPTFGYLVGLIVAPPLVATLVKLLGSDFGAKLVAVLVAEAVVFSCGIAWLVLSGLFSFEGALAVGLVPFVLPEFAKSVAVLGIVYFGTATVSGRSERGRFD